MLSPSNFPQWRCESGAPAPKRVVYGDDTLPADIAYRLMCEGTAVLWQGDFHNARQLLQALARRTEKKSNKKLYATAWSLHSATMFLNAKNA